MLSLQRCRDLLGTHCKLADSQLEPLRAELYALAEVALGECGSKKASQTNSDNGSCLTAIPESERQSVEERAAILEFEAGLSRPEAERQAFGEWARKQQPPKKRNKAKPRKKKR